MSKSSERFLRTEKASVEEYDDTPQYKTDSLRSLRRPVESPAMSGRIKKTPADAGLFDPAYVTGD